MQLFTVELFFLLAVLDNSQSRLSSATNVCYVTETFTERSVFVTEEPVTVMRKTKCWNIFKLFSCTTPITLTRQRTVPRIYTKTRLVEKCCQGFKEKYNRCVPVCQNGCKNGKCTDPEFCSCDIGYYGARCEKECPDGSWGKFCAKTCNCSENGRCNRIYGCVCHPGWKGDMCESPCEDGYYGYMCKQKCNCNQQSCDHQTGHCKSTTETQLTTIQPPSTTNPVEVIPKQVFTTTDDTLDWNDIKDKTSTAEMSTEDSIEGVSVETNLNIGNSTAAKTMSGPENFEISHFTTESTIQTDVSTTEDETTTTTMELIRSEKNEVIVPSVTGIKELVSTELPVNFTFRINFENASEQLVFNKTKLKVNRAENKGTSDIDLAVIAENPDKVQTKVKNNISAPEMFDEGKSNINKTWIDLIGAVQLDKNETESLILEGNGNSSQETIFKWLHFLPTLSVLPAVSFLIIIIAAIWVLIKHKRKAKMVVVASEKNRVFQLEERVKFQTDNAFWVNNCTVNPVYLSDVDLNNTPPVLETFKPLNNDKRLWCTAEKNK